MRSNPHSPSENLNKQRQTVRPQTAGLVVLPIPAHLTVVVSKVFGAVRGSAFDGGGTVVSVMVVVEEEAAAAAAAAVVGWWR